MTSKSMRHFVCLAAVAMLFGGCLATKKAEPAASEKSEPVGIVNESNAPEVPMTPKPEVSKPKTVAKAKPVSVEPEETEETEAVEPVAEPAPVAVKAPTPVDPFDHYDVTLKANGKALKVGDVLSMHVNIKAQDYPVKGDEAHGVQITFSGLGFVAEKPAVECLRATPSGSEVIYNVTAKKEGIYRVTAVIAVSPTRECKVFSTYKTSAPIVVTVD